jgi:hypothetical protein
VIQITKAGVRTERDRALLRLPGERDEKGFRRSDGHHNRLSEPVLSSKHQSAEHADLKESQQGQRQ